MCDNVVIQTIGGRIKWAIFCRGITQKRLCEVIGISQNALVNYIKNRRIPPKPTILSIARECLVEPEWLLNKAVNSNVIEVLIKCLEPISRISLREMSLKMDISQMYFSSILKCQIEPDMSFIENFFRYLPVEEATANKYLLNIYKEKKGQEIPKNIQISIPEIKITEDSSSKLREIIDLISDDNDAQNIILDMARTLKKRKPD